MARSHQLTKLLYPIAVGLAVALVVVALAATGTINAVKSTFVGIAGTETAFDFGVSVRLGVELVVGGGLGAKVLSQRRRLKEQRQLLDKYEKALNITQAEEP